MKSSSNQRESSVSISRYVVNFANIRFTKTSIENTLTIPKYTLKIEEFMKFFFAFELIDSIQIVYAQVKIMKWPTSMRLNRKIHIHIRYVFRLAFKMHQRLMPANGITSTNVQVYRQIFLLLLFLFVNIESKAKCKCDYISGRTKIQTLYVKCKNSW